MNWPTVVFRLETKFGQHIKLSTIIIIIIIIIIIMIMYKEMNRSSQSFFPTAYLAKILKVLEHCT